MKALRRVVALCLCVLSVVLTDPCDDNGHQRIPNQGYRYINFIIDPSETPYHDSRLEEGWYGVGKEPMPESSPDDIFTCGTKFPIWLKGKHPTDDTEVKMTACMMDLMDNCSSTYEVKIKFCQTEGFYVYYLKPTNDAEQGYCFGVGKNGSTTSYIAPKPTATFELHTNTTKGRPMSSVRFKCNFIESKEALFYRVSWWRGNKLWYNTYYTNTSTDERLLLTEEIFEKERFQMGDTIACSVRAFELEEGPPSKPSSRSNGIFVGIEVLTPSLSFQYGEPDQTLRTIQLRPTVPIGCHGQTDCTILLTAYTNQGQFGNCSGVVLEHIRCGVLINSKTYSSVLNIPVTTADNGQYPTSDLYEIYLKTDIITHNVLWSNYSLPPVKVHVSISKQIYPGKKCYAVPDPHFGTFDGLAYDNHQEGVYTLYVHTKLNAEMQLKHGMCNTYSDKSIIMCPCGFAARAGQDRYVIDACNSKLSIDYKNCGDDTIVVKRLTDTKYKIALPHGTYAEVEIKSNPFGGRNVGNLVLYIYIYPSVHDEARGSRGLCGQLDNSCYNDLHDKAGNTITTDGSLCGTSGQQPATFIQQWRVMATSENMFHGKFDIHLGNPWQHKICSCEKKYEYEYEYEVEVINRIPCNKNSMATCSKGTTVHARSCSAPHIHRRSVRRNPVIPIVAVSEPSRHLRLKRTISSNWTEAMARSYCRSSMKKSPVYDLCGQVPNVRQNESEENCISDILLTGGIEWTSLAVDSMQGSCLAELERNTTLRETNNSTQPSIAERIEEKACPSNCSGVGVCVKGQCDCKVGYGTSDCSLDISIAPTISGLLDNGLCDEKTLKCDHAYVFGHVFTDSMNLTCKLDEFTISIDGTRKPGTTHFLKGELETLIEVICPLHQINRRKRSTLATAGGDDFVLGFSISASNDGKHFDTGHELFVFNSECQDMRNVSGQLHFSLQNGYCFIENQCVREGERSQRNNCSICRRSLSQTAWAVDSTQPDCANIASKNADTGSKSTSKVHMDSNPNYLWIIGVVGGVVAGIIIAAVVFVKRIKNRAKTVGASTLLMTSKPDICAPCHFPGSKNTEQVS